jgi:protocatechuate 3,4-dioxygenase beta subunit
MSTRAPYSFVTFTLIVLLTSSLVALQESDQLDKSKFTLAISGKVIDQSGQPVPNVSLRILKGISATAISDERGEFRLMTLPTSISGRLLIAESDDGNQNGSIKMPYRPEGDQLSGLEIVMGPARDLAIQVLDAGGQPAADVDVGMVGSFFKVLDAKTGADGKVNFKLINGMKVIQFYAFHLSKGFDYHHFSASKDSNSLDTAELISDEPLQLQLAESNKFTIRLINPQREPVPGIKVYPWLLQKPELSDNFNLSSNIDLFGAVTDANGEATFDWIPAWHSDSLTFWANSKDYTRNRISYQPEAIGATRYITEIVQKLIPISGIVKNPDGTPAANLSIRASGHPLPLTTDKLGRFQFKSPPEKAHLMVSDHEQLKFIAGSHFAVHSEPLEDLEFQLRQGTRLHGTLTYGDSKTPMLNKTIRLRRTAKNELQLKRLDGSTYEVSVGNTQIIATDEEGKFEFFAGGGIITVRGPSVVDPIEFELGPDTLNKELNFHADRLDSVTLTGTVQDRNGQPAQAIQIEGTYTTRSSTGYLRPIKTDDAGKFSIERETFPLAILATSPDERSIAFQRLGELDDQVKLSLQASVTIHGRLVDTAGEPVANQMLLLRNRLYYQDENDRRAYETLKRSTTMTNENGEFICTGFAPEILISIYKVTSFNEQGGPMGIHQVTEASPRFNENLVQLGNIVFNENERFRGGRNSVPNNSLSFITQGRAATHYLNKLKKSRKMSQRVLVVFGDPASTIAQRARSFLSTDSDLKSLHQHFHFLAIDSTRAEDNYANQLAAKFGIELDDSEKLQLAVTGTDGKVVEKSAFSQTEFNSSVFSQFLASTLPDPIDARQELDKALTEAKKQNKRLLVLETATWCEESLRLSTFLSGSKNTWRGDFILLEIDQRWKGGPELCERLRGDQSGGLPWYGVLGADGKVIASSNNAEGDNVGMPYFENGQTHFVDLFRGTSEHITEEQLKRWSQSLFDSLEPKK